MVPLIFEPYAADMANRLASRSLKRVLEIAAGTGVVTRSLATRLPEGASIISTDLNLPMLKQAALVGTFRPVHWAEADALSLPFGDQSFDAVVCQFAAMFFPDKPKAFSEARRVLRPGGVYIFNVWDRIQENEFFDAVTIAMEAFFPTDPPRFFPRTPYGYHDTSVITRDLAAGGFTEEPQIETISARSRAESAQIPAIALCQGTPLRSEINERDRSLLVKATQFAAEEIARRFGNGPVDGKIQAHVITVEKSSVSLGPRDYFCARSGSV